MQKFLDTLYPILVFLDGKKNYIAGAILLTNSFLGLKHVYDGDTVAYVAAMTALLMGGAEYSTVKLGARK